MADIRIGFHAEDEDLRKTFERLAHGLHIQHKYFGKFPNTHDVENEIKRQFPGVNFFVPSFVGTPSQILVGKKVACAAHTHLLKNIPMTVVVDLSGYKTLRESRLPANSIRAVIGIGLLRPPDLFGVVHPNARWLKVDSCRWTERELDGAASYLYKATRSFEWGVGV